MIGCFLIWVLDFSIISMTNYCHSGSPTRGSYHSYISKNLRVSQTEKKKREVSHDPPTRRLRGNGDFCLQLELPHPHGFQLSYARVNQIKWGYSHLTPTPSDRLVSYSLILILGLLFLHI